MTVIELKFPAGGRFHATPWGRHVNEGATEWPPSPWRIQRALVATWYLKAREIEEPVVRSLMDALASTLPAFELPSAVQSHTRHYMPGRGTDKPKVFDTFVQSSKPLRLAWDVQLDDGQRQSLGILCDRLGYLGRAESIVEASLLPAGTVIQANSLPMVQNEDVGDHRELIRVLCASTPSDHAVWLTINQPDDAPKVKPKKGKGRTATPALPASIFDALHAETAMLQSQGWLIPPGSQWAEYSRQIEAFEPEPLRSRRTSRKTVTVARFAVASTVLPRITDAISVAGRLHQTLAKRADKKLCASVFTGKDANGVPLKDHQHTHIFCELGEKRDTIGFITLYAPGGFNAEAQRVIEEVQRKPLWGHGGHDLDIILLGFGDKDTFDIPLFAKARRWTSLTPFVSTRHAKHYSDGRPKLDEEGWPIGSPAQDLRRLIRQESKVALKSVSQPINTITVRPQRTLRVLQYQTQRFQGEGRHGHQAAAAFSIEFEKPVSGPLAFGYGSHFGLGLFVPAD
jgi:CRISPR-associated protein Csb2